MRTRFLLSFLLVVGLMTAASAQSKRSLWVDSVFMTMNQEAKIGQLFMLSVEKDNYRSIENEIRNHEIGGVIFKEGGPAWQAKVTRSMQELTAVPLLVGIDTEWKQGVSIDSAVNFPSPLVLGATENDKLVYAQARESGRLLRELGVHINFDLPAEIYDPSNYRQNKFRSFGSNKENVSTKAIAFMNGMKDEGIISCAKHFELKGLTVTSVQGHLPTFTASVDSSKVYSYQELIKNDLRAILPSPVDLPLFYARKADVKKNKLGPSGISALYTGDWIKKNMNYNGLVFVDIGHAKKTGKYKSGEAETIAIQAGNDIIITADNIGGAIRRIKKLLKKEKHYNAVLDSTVKRILATKYDAGLYLNHKISIDNLVKRIASSQTQFFKQKVFEAAVTITHDKENLLPIKSLENRRIALLVNSKTESSEQFFKYLSKYADIAQFALNEKPGQPNETNDLSKFDIVIAAIFPYDSLDKLLPSLRNISINLPVIACDFGHPSFLQHAEEFSAVITSYASESDLVRSVPQIIFGGLRSRGVLPIAISETIREGSGIKTASLDRFTYTVPEEAGMDSRTLERIDKIANEAIKMGATPGCHVLVAKDGKIVYEKSFGYLTYDKKKPVSDETIYDLASVTKVTATLQAVMFMYDRGLIDINKKASYYLPELKNSNKKDYTLKDILTHQAGLWPFLPFWASTMKDSAYLPEFYSTKKSDEYPLMVSENLYAPASIRDSLWHWIVNAKVREKPDRTPYDYRYSDMGFYILKQLAEKMLNQPIEDFLQQNLYEPLGSSTTGYLPLQRFSYERIAPTENDKLFRRSLLIGVVHDQGAAMMGGVSGHAGLFSTANDLAKLGQMLLQEGSYGGYRYYKPETVRLFTQRTFTTSRRGLGWDKPTPSDPSGPTSLYASPKTFGHTGFTGTCIWVDPEFNLVYVFLSNRVHPDMTNNKLINANIRSRVQDVIYESIFNYCQF
jgi:beta-N-acetylhexosaminidase